MTSSSFDRRTFLAAGTATAALSGMPMSVGAWAQASAAVPPAPKARVAPVTDDYYGTKVTDPYRWMEDPKDPEWQSFMRGQGTHTRAVLDAIPGRAAMAKRVSALTGDAAATRTVTAAGDLLFYEQRPVGADNYKLFVRSGDGTVRTLIDPTTMGTADAHVSLDWWVPSFDGRYLAYGLSASGSEASILHVMEVASGRVLPERIEKTDFGAVSWLPDASGFFYLQMTGERGTPSFYIDSVTKLHRLGGDPAADPILFKRDLYADVPVAPVQIPVISTSPGSSLAFAMVRDIRTEFALYVTSLDALTAARPAWRKVVDFDDVVTGVALRDDDLYLLSNAGHVRGRVLRTSASAPNLSGATEVVPEGEAVLESIAAAKDGVIVTIMDGGVQRLSRIAPDGKVAPIALPFEGSVAGVYASPDKDGAYLNLTGWLQPSGIYRLSGDGSIANTGINPAPPIDVSPYETRRAFATAKDGVRIPYTLLFKRGMKADRSNPTLISAYGAYQISGSPAFSPRVFAFLDAGGVYGVANVRGGGEYGREWHKGGQKATKPNTWRDLIAVCEQVVADGVTQPSKLAIIGGSAGGMTVGRAMNERPDLFAAVVNLVGWVNPLRYTAEQNVSDIDEWGPIADAESFRIMQAMDAYQAVEPGVKYPAVLCQTGITDPRVAPWHMAKFAARLQAATGSDKPVLLRVDFDAGHGVGSTRAQSDALYADAYSFVLWRTGAAGFQPVTSG